MQPTISIQLNGRTTEVPAELTVSRLLAHLSLPQEGTLVERNGLALFPREFETTPVEPCDRIELVRIAAGG